ncbi:hypothetical protein VDQ87_16370, partial [Xanthomonas campestris pv. campestris]|nr:hypothetical protein [Xanthomonas campestris pv. campestris]
MFIQRLALAGQEWARACLRPLKNAGKAYFVAPEKPPITQRPQGLDVCSGVPELPVFATLKAGFWQFPLMHTRRP